MAVLLVPRDKTRNDSLKAQQFAVYQHIVPRGQKINANYYIYVLHKLKMHISRKRLALMKKIILQHDVHPHTTKYLLKMLPYFPYVQNLAPRLILS